MPAVPADTPPPLPGPYGTPPAASALRPSPAVVRLVRGQIQALLMSTPVYHALDSAAQRNLEQNLVKIASYAAECVRDDWYQSLKLGQRPMVRVRETMHVPAPSQPQ